MFRRLGLNQDWIGFSISLRLAKMEGYLKETRFCRGGPRLSHQFFTDDSIIFVEATLTEETMIKSIIQWYELLSSHQFEILFSSNVIEDCCDMITQSFGVHHTWNIEHYLGLPIMVLRNKRVEF
ncbi:reverse transcriptase [Gossypium australe]|uniref:Reverse transcriptase n=1 Tax=Gossypium australe TaxID=47621 RepID=A0A5B6WT88_9ROSI|nr:reverse transcriptase [Gossypium australe]